MEMTHYMELLMANQPWNLIFFMAIPVILAETIAITELYLLFTRNLTGTVKKLSRICGIFAGIYFTGVFLYLFTQVVIPLSAHGGWRTCIDGIAVGFYLAGVVPLGGMALLELGLIARKNDTLSKLRIHTIFVAMFLIVAHIAMIFGMLSPSILSGGAMKM